MKEYILALLFVFSIQESFSNCEIKENRLKPVHSVNISNNQKYLKKFVAKHGNFKTYKNLKKFINDLCSENFKSKTPGFKATEMFSFIIKEDCSSQGALTSENGKKIRHAAIAGSALIIGGGEIKCHGKEELFLTNRSNQYCFPVQALTYIAKELIALGYDPKKILIQHKQKKMCSIKKNKRLRKYKKIIQKKYIDFGYKKNHIYSAEEFIKRVNSI